jgi:hypothetical protein
MRLQVLLRRNGVSDLEDAVLARDAARWLTNKLLNPFQMVTLDVKVAMRQRRAVGGLGKCRSFLDRPRHFVVLIDRGLDTYWKTRTLAHEFTHLRQLVVGDLVYRRIDGVVRTYWRGEDHTDTPYDEQPWEIEANAAEEALAREFLINVKGWRPTMARRAA